MYTCPLQPVKPTLPYPTPNSLLDSSKPPKIPKSPISSQQQSYPKPPKSSSNFTKSPSIHPPTHPTSRWPHIFHLLLTPPTLTLSFPQNPHNMFRFASLARPLARTAPLALAGVSLNFIANDTAKAGIDGVDVDSGIDPFPTQLSKSNCSVVNNVQKLIATGVRSVTFISFKVYAVGLYVPKNYESQIGKTVGLWLKETGKSPAELLEDKQTSQEMLAAMSEKLNYTIRITPVRNTDFGHLRDGFVKTILACPMTKTKREEVAVGVEQLRDAFKGFKGSVPKNHSLYLVSENSTITMHYEGKNGDVKTLGKITEPSISQVLFVLYFSSVKPISEPLRKSFVSYVTATV